MHKTCGKLKGCFIVINRLTITNMCSNTLKSIISDVVILITGLSVWIFGRLLLICTRSGDPYCSGSYILKDCGHEGNDDYRCCQLNSSPCPCDSPALFDSCSQNLYIEYVLLTVLPCIICYISMFMMNKFINHDYEKENKNENRNRNRNRFIFGYKLVQPSKKIDTLSVSIKTYNCLRCKANPII